MAVQCTSGKTEIQPRIAEDLRRLLWGGDVKQDVFKRWTQGFVFSEDERSALIQKEGGPCSVIAPVQAFILKSLLFSEQPTQEWRTISEEQADQVLQQALCDILQRVSSGPTFTLTLCESGGGCSDHEEASNSTSDPEHSPKKRKLSYECYHDNLRCVTCTSRQELSDRLQQLLPNYKGDYGVLMFLYSVILSKGLEQIKNEVEDPGEPLIDGTYGHGSQCLINLLLTGKAISNVWDNDKEVEGLKLKGITEQATVGFLSLLEHLRYCEVGWYLKNPEYPLWLLGSETHLTLLFSKEISLVTRETPDLIAKRIFARFDPEGNGFIATELLQDVMCAAQLVCEPEEYVTIMKKKLDPEQLGIITQNAFMAEFYPDSQKNENLETFTLYHYNGLQRSCPEGKVVYQEATANITMPSDIQVVEDSSTISACLQTKWPTIELHWKSGQAPSMN